MSWGYRILILYVVFVLGIVFMIYKANTYKVELEDKDYYAEELKFQSVLDATKNAKALSTHPVMRDSSANIVIVLPHEFSSVATSGDLRFIRLDDQKKDRAFKINTSSAQQLIPKAGLASGLYKVKLRWKANNTDYYYEDSYTVLP